jgi:energy-coupling factor transport system substrate-specific component
MVTERIKREFSTISFVLIPMAIAINIAVGQLIKTLQLPLYLDSIGTVLVGVLVGPWAGALTGFLSNTLWTFTGLFTPAIAFAVVAAVIGALAGSFRSGDWMEIWWKAILAGLITGIIAAILSAPIAAYVFGGVMGTGTDILYAIFRSVGLNSLYANMARGTFSDPADKAVTFLLIWFILRTLPTQFKARFIQD